MNVLLVTNDFPPIMGGISNYYYNLSRHYSAGKIFVLTGHVDNIEAFDNEQAFPIYRKKVPLNPGIIPRLIQMGLFFTYALPIIKRENIQVIICGHLNLAPIAFLLEKIAGVPYCIILFGGELKKYMRFRLIKKVFLYLLRKARLIVTISEFSKTHYTKQGAVIARYCLVPPAPTMEWLDLKIDPTFLYDKYGLHECKIILTIGRLVERKGHDMVIKALPKVVQQVPNVRYLIVGKGPYEEHLRKIAERHKVLDNVIFTGFVDSGLVPAFYQICSVFIMPSREIEERDGVEGFGIVYLEANSFGKPVIGGKSGGVSDAVKDGVTGLLVDPLSINEIADALIRLLTDKDYASLLGRNGKERIEKELNWSLQMPHFEKQLSSIL
ncbi:MAG: glycosyltransferase family 4 protein [bacterium]